MGDVSHIEWTDATWNPITGCTRVSPGCDHCYIARTPPFRMAGRRFNGEGPGSTTGVVLHPDRLEQPLHWRKPRRVFVNSLADLFHDSVPDYYIARVFGMMAASPRHTFQVLTKRHARMRSLLNSEHFRDDAHSRLIDIVQRMTWEPKFDWPLPNVWLGVSVETQQWADIRIPALLHTPAAVRFLSCEPLLGPVDLNRIPAGRRMDGGPRSDSAITAACRECGGWGGGSCPPGPHYVKRPDGIDWVIAGGESGPGARPMHPDWARSLRNQCTTTGVPFFFKQWGEWGHGAHRRDRDHVVVQDGRHEPYSSDHFAGLTPLGRARELKQPGTSHAEVMSRVGKRTAGRELDGRTWDQMPAGAR